MQRQFKWFDSNPVPALIIFSPLTKVPLMKANKSHDSSTGIFLPVQAKIGDKLGIVNAAAVLINHDPDAHCHLISWQPPEKLIKPTTL